MKYTASVIIGHGRGKTLGFPTFNLSIPKNFNLRHGIYACWAWLGKKKYPGALHYGPVPVFNQPHPTLEIFILDYNCETISSSEARYNAKQYRQFGNSRTTYNSDTSIDRLTFQPVKYLRPIKNFSSPQTLKAQIAQDVAAVRTTLSR